MNDYLKMYAIHYRNVEGERDHFYYQAYDMDEAESYAYTWASRQVSPVSILYVEESAS